MLVFLGNSKTWKKALSGSARGNERGTSRASGMEIIIYMPAIHTVTILKIFSDSESRHFGTRNN